MLSSVVLEARLCQTRRQHTGGFLYALKGVAQMPGKKSTNLTLATKPLNKKQVRFVDLICRGSKVEDAADVAGITLSAARVILRRDDVRDMQIEYAKDVLRNSAGKAAETLVRQLESDNPWIAQQAAVKLLGYLDTFAQQQNQTIVVNFGEIPAPGMPPAIGQVEEVPLSADGEVR